MMQTHVVRRQSNVSKEHTAFIFTAEENAINQQKLNLQPDVWERFLTYLFRVTLQV